MAAWLKLDEAIYQNIRRHVREELGEEKISLLQTGFLYSTICDCLEVLSRLKVAARFLNWLLS
jgi:hypothetical protein